MKTFKNIITSIIVSITIIGGNLANSFELEKPTISTYGYISDEGKPIKIGTSSNKKYDVDKEVYPIIEITNYGKKYYLSNPDKVTREYLEKRPDNYSHYYKNIYFTQNEMTVYLPAGSSRGFYKWNYSNYKPGSILKPEEVSIKGYKMTSFIKKSEYDIKWYSVDDKIVLMYKNYREILDKKGKSLALGTVESLYLEEDGEYLVPNAKYMDLQFDKNGVKIYKGENGEVYVYSNKALAKIPNTSKFYIGKDKKIMVDQFVISNKIHTIIYGVSSSHFTEESDSFLGKKETKKAFDNATVFLSYTNSTSFGFAIQYNFKDLKDRKFFEVPTNMPNVKALKTEGYVSSFSLDKLIEKGSDIGFWYY